MLSYVNSSAIYNRSVTILLLNAFGIATDTAQTCPLKKKKESKGSQAPFMNEGISKVII